MGQSMSDERRSLDDNDPRFEYTSLPTPTSIRIVKLDSTDDEEHISLSMNVVDLNDEVYYDCLSYTWGRPCTIFKTQDDRDAVQEIGIPILVNGGVLPIGQNVFDFLKAWQERQRRLMGSIRVGLDDWDSLYPHYRVSTVLWIDAICIDQSNMAERNAQVAKMSRIFRQARRVVAWLGPEDAFFRPAFEVMKDIAHREGTESTGLPPIWSSAWFNVFALFQRSWFSRAWVVQEVIVAQELAMQVGTFTFSWETIVHAAYALYWRDLIDPIYAYASAEVHATNLFEDSGENSLQIHGPLITRGQAGRLFSTADGEDSSERIQGVEFVLLLHDLREKRTFMTIKNNIEEHQDILKLDRSFLFLLQYMQRTECTDARDRVYAFVDLLGRVSSPVGEPSPLRKDITPNYNLSLAQVYRDVAWYIILSGRNLDLLSFASGPTNTLEGLPSWAPDWRNRATIAADVLTGQPENVTVSATICPIWELSKRSSIYGQYLYVEGSLVALVAEVCTERLAADATTPYILGPAAEFMKTVPACRCTTNKLSSAQLLWRTLTLNDRRMNCCHDLVIRTFCQIWHSESKRAAREFQRNGKASRDDMLAILETYARGHHPLFENLDTAAILGVEDTDFDQTVRTQFQPDRFYEIMGTLSQLQMAPQDDLPGDVVYLKQELEEEVEKMMLAYTEDAPKHNTCTEYDTGRYDSKLKISSDVMFPWSHHYTQLRKLSKRMRLFRTDRQHIGNGPRAMQSGDQVWILSGAKVPIILRPTREGLWKVVGEAYIHGMMRGEAARHPNYQTRRVILE